MKEVDTGMRDKISSLSIHMDDFLIIANDPVILARSKSILKVTHSIQISILNSGKRLQLGMSFCLSRQTP